MCALIIFVKSAVLPFLQYLGREYLQTLRIAQGVANRLAVQSSSPSDSDAFAELTQTQRS
jgi:hypothetical protein